MMLAGLRGRRSSSESGPKASGAGSTSPAVVSGSSSGTRPALAAVPGVDLGRGRAPCNSCGLTKARPGRPTRQASSSRPASSSSVSRRSRAGAASGLRPRASRARPAGVVGQKYSSSCRPERRRARWNRASPPGRSRRGRQSTPCHWCRPRARPSCRMPLLMDWRSRAVRGAASPVSRAYSAAGLVTVSRVRSTGARWIRGVSDGGRMSACMAQPP